MKKIFVLVIALSIMNIFAVNPRNTRIDTLQTLNTFSSLGQFYKMQYYGDYNDMLDHLDDLYTSGAEEPDNEFHCSLFSAVGDTDNVYYGRNFDNPECRVLLAQYSPPDGYKNIALNRIGDTGIPNSSDFENLSPNMKNRLLKAPYFAADGINEHGLAAGLAYVEAVPSIIDPEKDTIFITRLIREILDHAMNVEEALEIANSYNIFDVSPGIVSHHVLVTDPSGTTRIFEYHDGAFLAIDPGVDWQVLTNIPIYNQELTDLFDECWRYEALYEALEDQNGIVTDWRNGLDILDLPTWGNIGNGTQWSTLSHLNNKGMYVSLYRNFENIVYVDIENFEFINYGDFTINDHFFTDENGDSVVEPGEYLDLFISLTNDFPSTGVEAEISCTDPNITIVNSSSQFGNIDAEGYGVNLTSPFRIELSDSFQPHYVNFDFVISTDYDYEYETNLAILIESVDNNINELNKIKMKNYPNPFQLKSARSITNFEFYLPENSKVTFDIFNVKGQKIKSIYDGKLDFGNQKLTWDGTNSENKKVESGIYLYKLQTNSEIITDKLLIVK